MNRLDTLLEEKLGTLIKETQKIREGRDEEPAYAPTVPSGALQTLLFTLSTIANDLKKVVVLVETQIAGVAHQQSESIEGVFTGEAMLGADSIFYEVPPNYASKSRLVEGDLLKRTMTIDGRPFYTQLERAERKTIFGRVQKNDKGFWEVLGADGNVYRVLTASITFYQGEVGDTASILVPKEGGGTWGAVERIFKIKSPSDRRIDSWRGAICRSRS